MAAFFKKIAAFVAGKPIVDPSTGAPTTEFLRALNNNINNIRTSGNQLAQVIEDLQATIVNAGIALTTAQAVQASLEAAERDRILVGSYVSPNDILSSDVDPADSTKRRIIIANHDRIYGDGTTVTVTGATLAGLLAGADYLIYYDDPTRAGGAVSYTATVDPTLAVQGGDRHTVGYITTVGSGSTTPTTGGGTTGPGIPTRRYNEGIEEV